MVEKELKGVGVESAAKITAAFGIIFGIIGALIYGLGAPIWGWSMGPFSQSTFVVVGIFGGLIGGGIGGFIGGALTASIYNVVAGKLEGLKLDLE